MKKNLFILFFVASLVNGCNTGSNKPSSETTQSDGLYHGTIKAGHLVALDHAPLFVAKEAGYFKQNGIDLETVAFSNPGDNNTALAGGSIQFSANPFTLPYFAVNSGINMQIVSAAGGLGVIEVVIQGKYKVTSISALISYIKAHKGKKLKIAVLKGDTLEMMIYKILTDNGLTYDDVEMIWFNDLLAMVDAFKTKQVDVLSFLKPYSTDLIVNYGATSIATNSDVWGEGTPNCTVDIMEDFGKKYPKTVEAYIKSLNQGFDLIVNQPDSAVALLEKGGYFKVGKDVLLYAFKNQPKKVTLRPNVAGMNQAIDNMVTMGYIKKPTKEVVNLRFLEAALPNQ